jgi:hypothetical protein
MDLIDRYVASIRRNLPHSRADDIAAELRDVLASRVEDKEEMLGRRLTPEETAALLKDFGHPLIVAARYRKQQWLIGPDVFPFYLAVLRVVLTVLAAIFVVGVATSLLFRGGGIIHSLGQAFGGLWMSLMVSLAIVTIVFVVLERTGFPADHVHRWDPAQLPDVDDKQPGPWESAIEVAFGVGFLLWWTGLIHIPFAMGGASFRMEPAPIFAQLYWPILALAAARLVHNLVQWLRPRWKAVRATLAVLTTIGGLILLGMLYRAGSWVTIVPTGLGTDQAAALQTSVNLACRIAIVVAAIVWTLNAMLAVYRLSRSRPLEPVPA